MTIKDLTDLVSDKTVKERYPWCKDERSITSAKKEVIGEILLKEYHILSSMYSERFRKVTDLDLQKSGVDFSSYSHKVDLKASIGDYTDGSGLYECIPIELTQNGKTTFTSDKKTTDLLFFNVNVKTNKIYFISLPYEVVLEIVNLNIKESDNIFSQLHPYYIYNKQTSYNGSAVFINMPICRIFDRAVVMEYPLSENIKKIIIKNN